MLRTNNYCDFILVGTGFNKIPIKKHKNIRPPKIIIVHFQSDLANKNVANGAIENAPIPLPDIVIPVVIPLNLSKYWATIIRDAI